jgi:hypothetical protein
VFHTGDTAALKFGDFIKFNEINALCVTPDLDFATNRA